MMFPLALLCLCLAALCALVLVARKDLPHTMFADPPPVLPFTPAEKLDHRLDTLSRQPIDWAGLDAEMARRQQARPLPFQLVQIMDEAEELARRQRLDAALKTPLATVRREGIVVHIRPKQRVQ